MAKSPREFTPLTCSMSQIRACIPQHLFQRNTLRSSAYAARDLSLAITLWWAASSIDVVFDQKKSNIALICYALCWLTYWWFQGLVFTGLWVIGHECGHGAFSRYETICNVLGYIIHTALWTPYFSWKIVHHRHHANHASMERDEVYIPKTRADLGLPSRNDGSPVYYSEYFSDTPLWTLLLLILQQLFAFPAYLLYNASGQREYPKWTNHFNPNAVLFNRAQRNAVIVSDIGILGMIILTMAASSAYSFESVVKFYLVPWLCVSHWFIMITYLHHTSANLPHYRSGEWNFQRGAASTVDRDFLGWQGRFFLHDVAHFHVVHHFFPQMPWYNGEEATRHLQQFLGEHYHKSEEPVFSALWKTYNDCQFVENDGDILFYKNKDGSFAMLSASQPHNL